eukprot:TRINITY_DN2855_c0_g1_i1.p1 TRINITY_DN2855_c0_g1~~TRINITY_DN2855_c0_g1_i1.p1  ORF type:complete len:417 (+),score=94.19 TRINITY_DN2855_c0_g1_i1:41-1291(+)
MKVIVFLALIFAVALALSDAPGVCNTTGGLGVGCTFDASKLDPNGVDIKPKKPLFKWTYCADKCLTPEHQWDPDCPSDCVYTNMFGQTWKLPREIYLDDEASSTGCYASTQSAHVEDYVKMVGHSHSHHGLFHSSSKVSVKFYEEYYEEDRSMTTQSRMLIWHSIVLPIQVANLGFEAKISIMRLPSAYNASTKAKYQTFLQEYGTHYMDSAHVGGLATYVGYFHSCMIAQNHWSYVHKSSGWSFFGIVGDQKAAGSGSHTPDKKWQQWSNENVTIIGGFPHQFSEPTTTKKWAPGTFNKWLDGVHKDMAPVSYSLTPITEIIKLVDAGKAAQMQLAINDYMVAVGHVEENLVSKLKPKDPMIRPSWCHFSPKPGFRRNLQQSDLSTPNGLPGCPSLPTIPMDKIEARMNEINGMN